MLANHDDVMTIISIINNDIFNRKEI